MGRWEPGARGRLTRAALELYSERGYEQTTVADIAAHAGVTERTFFRHFADKREVLFDGSGELQQVVVAGVAGAPQEASALAAVAAGMQHGAEMLQRARHGVAVTRAGIVAANPALTERELAKLAALADAAAETLRTRGVPGTAARLAAETGVTVFKVAFARWVEDGAAEGAFTTGIREAFAELTGLTRD